MYQYVHVVDIMYMIYMHVHVYVYMMCIAVVAIVLADAYNSVIAAQRYTAEVHVHIGAPRSSYIVHVDIHQA